MRSFVPSKNTASEIDPYACEVTYDAETSELVQLSSAPAEQNATV